ncbi:MAG: hypothetical protein EKK51_31545 [Mycolicibacterium sp.]|uniref:hypothetical protein n=1 Tax=Mycolicibacterium sp. TaxID=2320850 RepID=UPI000FB0B4BA|nr:hypothetical protein [Mycolicibacterium sp.]RUP25864.1 MAG: hypothetical protein EKK51_31545 [Mycolicibacterium sp.]
MTAAGRSGDDPKGRDRRPAPGSRPLKLDIECFNAVSGAGGEKHRVTINADLSWSMTTPHDAEAERIAMAFGSDASCVTHMARTVEAFCASVGVLTGAERVPLSVGRGGSWQVSQAYSIRACCRGTLFGSAGAAARHTRSPKHLALQHRVQLKHFKAFLDAAARMWGSWDTCPEFDPRLERLVREPRGVSDLWQAGIHPDDIPELAAVGSVVDEPLPLQFFLGLAYGNADRQWVREVLSHHPDADTAAWLAWLDEPQARAEPEAWGQWLSFGISKAHVLVAIDAGLEAEYVREVASSNGWSTSGVAAQFVKWANVGCALKAGHFHALKRHRVYSPQPSVRAIDSLCELVAQDRSGKVTASDERPDRTELAVMLEILGNRYAVVRALNHGVRTVDDLDAYVKNHE